MDENFCEFRGFGVIRESFNPQKFSLSTVESLWMGASLSFPTVRKSLIAEIQLSAGKNLRLQECFPYKVNLADKNSVLTRQAQKF